MNSTDEVQTRPWWKSPLRLLGVAFLVIVTLAIAAFMLLLYLFSSAGDEPVDRHSLLRSLGPQYEHIEMTWRELNTFEQKRDALAYKINADIIRYFKGHRTYPEKLDALPIAKSEGFSDYRMGIDYHAGIRDGAPFFTMSWLAASPWNGMRCDSGIFSQDLANDVPSEKQPAPTISSCTIIDYH